MNQMRHGRWLLNLAFVTAAAGLFGSCRKTNGIDNNNVIRTPYSLFLTDREGALYSTTDGKTYRLVFPADGFLPRAVVTSGPNIIWVKRNVHLSMDNGLNFNPVDSSVDSTIPWQSLILSVPSHNRVYLSSKNGRGLRYSEDNGKSWKDDNNWDPNITNPTAVHSLTQLKNGELYAFNDQSNILYRRANPGAAWVEVAMNGLPGAGYFLSRFNNALLATDTAGSVHYSNDGGQNWGTYSGLPARRIRATVAPFDQTLLVGVDSAGVFQLQNGTFVPVNNGLEPNTTVYAIMGKEDTYKNDVIRQYIFIATNHGLYRSEDGGQNWILAKPGDVRRIF